MPGPAGGHKLPTLPASRLPRHPPATWSPSFWPPVEFCSLSHSKRSAALGHLSLSAPCGLLVNSALSPRCGIHASIVGTGSSCNSKMVARAPGLGGESLSPHPSSQNLSGATLAAQLADTVTDQAGKVSPGWLQRFLWGCCGHPMMDSRGLRAELRQVLCHIHVHSSMTSDGPGSVSRWGLSKLCCSHGKDRSTDTDYNTSELQSMAPSERSQTQRAQLYNSMCMRCPEGQEH